MASAHSMYIRVKRQMTTWFVLCEPTDKIADVKRKLKELTEQAEADQRLILMSTGEMLDDTKTLAYQKVENDCVVGLVFKLPDGSGWEELQIESPEDHMAGLNNEEA